MAESSNMQDLFVQATYEEILKLAGSVNHEQIRETISSSSPQKILTGTMLTLGALLTTLIVKKKGTKFLTTKMQSNIVYLAEMLVWKANQTVKTICDEVLHQRKVIEKLQCLDKMCLEIEKLRYDIERFQGMDVTKELIQMCERKMIDIDSKVKEVEKSCDRRIRDYDWKIATLTAHPTQQFPTHIDIINQHIEDDAETQIIQQHMNKQARVKLNSRNRL
ncbi:nonstructural protein [Human rotavirus B]|uniref:Non-structural glycoprotein 4 n=1 Tax=Rotavirus B (isolate RVB/Human/China/ADRV/1982) TaxID=10942 RepID=Q6XD97_ROTGA|nr:nonstructural protein [Human rotavirus B]AAQ18648.1 nonstructural protein [Human rotavirus B]